MKQNSPPRGRVAPGLTLLELTVVIAVLLSMTSLLYVGARAWKEGSDRATCIVTIRNAQMAVRSYQNVFGFEPGTVPMDPNGNESLAEQLLEREFITPAYYERCIGKMQCPGGGTYSCPDIDRFPWPGETYMVCSLARKLNHEPNPDIDW